MRLFEPIHATRRWLKIVLTVSGVLAGGIFGLALTRLGKIVSGAPPASLANYLWNAAVFAVLGGIVSPLVSWSALRCVPVWRTLAEPLAYAIAGGAAAVIAGSGLLLLALPPIGLALGFVRLRHRYGDAPTLPATRTAGER